MESYEKIVLMWWGMALAVMLPQERKEELSAPSQSLELHFFSTLFNSIYLVDDASFYRYLHDFMPQNRISGNSLINIQPSLAQPENHTIAQPKGLVRQVIEYYKKHGLLKTLKRGKTYLFD